MAEPGQTRPTMRDAWHLVAGGLRMRLRLPANRPLARVSAVLITMIGAALGGAAASWAAVEIGAPLPSNAKVSALATQVAPGGLDVGWFRSSMAWWMFEPAPRATELVDVP